ncbi:Xaa-Pro peptidase family protein [Paraburkholderia sp. J8-2]|uniref:M24 family metallopeptidase n=1 Tax=Paraburkholderia sp. J8-2 TaxID=2805440 RepID=UPI002AB70903|nr:Xaa-Pro peptidase family protein [Paraburkholderia sp. J8-2]
MWFDIAEYQSRLENAQKYMARHELDYLLVFEPELVTYLTGFYTLGYGTSFQCVLVPSSGLPLTVLRKAEQFHFNDTAAWLDKYLLWYDGESAPDVVIRAMAELSVKGRVGFDGASWRATTTIMDRVRGAIRASFIDLGTQLDSLRFIKSQAEIAYMREAGKAVSLMHEAGIRAVSPGATERDLMIATASAGLRGGSDQAEPGPLASGERAYHIHSCFQERVISHDDLVFLEMCAHKKNYHARCMRTIVVGQHDDRMVDTYRRFVDIQDEALATIRAGVHCSVPDRIVREGVVKTGWVDQYPNKTFYGIGMMFWPNTYEKLEVTHNADFHFEAGMTFHAYISARGLNISESIVITDRGHERLTTFDRGIILK